MANSKKVSKVERYYQSGASRDTAVVAGVNMIEFDALELEHKGVSIPLGKLLGIKLPKAYDCDYHTGGTQGAMLRTIALIRFWR